MIPFVIKKIVQNKSIDNINFQNQNDFIHVSDCCKILYKSIKKNLPSGIYNIGSGKLTSVYEIVSVILKFFNKKKLKNLKSFNQSIYASTFKQKKYIRYRNKKTIKDDKIKTIKYYE